MGTITLKGDVNVNADFTFPEGINIRFFNDAKLIALTGVTVTINGSINAGVYQIFSGEGTFTGTPKVECVFPEWFGAKGDGDTNGTNDYDALQNSLSLKKPLVLQSGKQYNSSSALNVYNSIKGDAILLITSATLIDGIIIHESSFFELRDFSIKPEITQNLFAQGKAGIKITKSSMFKVFNIEVSFFTDAISIFECERFEIENNNLHEVGEELIAIRYSTSWSVTSNDCYHHNGDAILIKVDALHGGLIEGNTVRDGVNPYGYSTKGGGITCNLEAGEDTAIEGLSIKSNIISATSYGITLVGAIKFDISTNKIFDLVNGKGIYVDVSPTYNPESVPGRNGVINGVINGNVIYNIFDDEGIVCTTTETINNLPCIISNNYVDINNSIQNAVRGENAVISGNIIKGGKINLTATNCSVTGNIFNDTSSTVDAGIKLYQRTTFIGNVAYGWNNYVQIRADFSGTASNNVFETTSSQPLFTILSGATGSINGNHLTNNGAGGTITEIDGVSVDNYTRRKNITQSRIAAPTSGTWKLGDIIYNANPVPSGFIGWVCVTGGSSATWKQFGQIVA